MKPLRSGGICSFPTGLGLESGLSQTTHVEMRIIKRMPTPAYAVLLYRDHQVQQLKRRFYTLHTLALD